VSSETSSASSVPTKPARYIMIGGFLGAGKTTAVARLAQRLTSQGHRVGLITNDQGHGLVDTALLRARGFATEEIAGGCFCCRFNSLLEAARRLSLSTRPDVFIAEPVGSCTDLLATVTYPLRRIYSGEYIIAPLSVLVDPIRAARVFGWEDGGRFSDKVLYIYRKQLEEANLIVINKADLLSPAALERLRAELAAEFPRQGVLVVSARTGAGLEEWFERIASTPSPAGQTMEVDYDIYAEGEARLGWVNATVQARSSGGFDPNRLLSQLAGQVQARLNERSTEVAHLKMTLNPEAGLGEIAAINLVRNDVVPELSLALAGSVNGGQIIINLRAEAAPDQLKIAVEHALAMVGNQQPGLTLRLDHLEHFRPGRPQPIHRVTREQAKAERH